MDLVNLCGAQEGDVRGDDAGRIAAELAAVGKAVDEVRREGCREGAVDVRPDPRVRRVVVLAPVPSPSAAAGDSPKKFPTQKSAVNGPAGDALTASTRLYSAGRLPRTSPAIRILTVFGSDISPVSLRWPGARELW